MSSKTVISKRVYPKVDTENVPVLDSWALLAEVGAALGLSRQQAYYWAAQGRFKTLHRLAGPEENEDGRPSKPTFVIKRSELNRIVAKREADRLARSAVSE
jgi:hypothetical protein